MATPGYVSTVTVAVNPIITAYINAAYPFRSLFYILRMLGPAVSILFDMKSITIKQRNESNRFLMNAVIHASEELLIYEFNPTDVTSEEEKKMICISAGVKTAAFEAVLKQCKAADGALITIMPGCKDIFFEPKNPESVANSTAGGFLPTSPSLINTHEQQIKNYNTPDYGDKKPNVKVLTSVFVNCLNAIIRSNASNIRFFPFEKGIRIVGIGSSGNVTHLKDFGDCSESIHPDEISATNYDVNSTQISEMLKRISGLSGSNGNPDVGPAGPSRPLVLIQNKDAIKTQSYVELPIAEVKFLIRLNNVSGATTIMKIYMVPGKPIGIFGKLSTYGDYQIFLRNSSTP